MDISFAGVAERLYNTQNVGNTSSNVKFSYATKESSDSEFLISCKNCHNCFGSIGLSNKSYCIFNRQYEQEEYFRTVDAIKTCMLSEGSYGEFFPMSFAPYPYNSSLAHIMYPMAQEEASKRGLLWQPDVEVDMSALQTVSVSELPDNIDDMTEALLSRAIIGDKSGKPFRLVPREVDFYKRYRFALPSDTPYQRIIDRYKIMSDFRLYSDTCFKCAKEISSAYKTSDGWKPYCTECYQQDFL
jgi:hypothetical protein